jgi:hypothetical protein
MTEDRKRRLRERVFVAFLIGFWLYFFYAVYVLIQIHEGFKAIQD